MLSLDELLRYGYFPKEIVPCFETKLLADNTNKIITKVIPHLKANEVSRFFQYSIPRLKNSRRKLAVPSLVSYLKLSYEVVNHWEEINNILNQSKNSLTKPSLRSENKTYERALNFNKSFHEIKVQKIIKSTNCRYMLKADISRFYGSIYTHSIPWAIHGKKIAKLNTQDSLFGNKLDRHIRNCQDQQTLGIPIGPDVSFLIAELIAAQIDVFLNEKLDGKVDFFHFLDDYYFFGKSLDDIEKANSLLREVLAEFELELHPEKTQIIELPDSIDKEWTFELRNFKFSSNYAIQREEILNYFNNVFLIYKRNPEDSVLKYAFSRIKKIKFHKKNWDLIENFILQLIVYESSLLPSAIEIIYTYEKLGYPIKKSKIKETIYYLLEYHVTLKHNFEITWTLWFAKSLKINIKKELVKKIASSFDPLIALILLDLKEKGLIASTISFEKWRDYLSKDFLSSEYWIFSYEAYKKGWLAPHEKNKNYIKHNKLFNILDKGNVEFFNTEKLPKEIIFSHFKEEIDIVEKLAEKLLKLRDETTLKEKIFDPEKVDIKKLLESMRIEIEEDTTVSIGIY